jgi:diacylglycerol kinase family enzyme
LIVNPFASGVTEERIAAVDTALRRVAELDVLLTARPGHATELAEAVSASGGCDAIFVFSGDGGFNEVVNGSDGSVPLGFLPGGGTNVLTRALGLPANPVAAAEQLAEALEAERVRTISLGTVNGRRFTFSGGIGFPAELVRRVDGRGRTEGRRRPGDVRYAVEMTRMLFEHHWHYEPVLEIVGVGRAAVLFVSNGAPYTYTGNVALRLSPEASFDGGLDFAAPARLRARDVTALVAYAARGKRRPRVFLHGHDLDRIEVHCDAPLALQVDGEDLGDVEHAVFEAERGALEVLS